MTEFNDDNKATYSVYMILTVTLKKRIVTIIISVTTVAIILLIIVIVVITIITTVIAIGSVYEEDTDDAPIGR